MAKQSKSATPQAAGYYDAFIAAWNNPTQPPPPAQGVGLTPTMSTQEKLGHVNAWTVTGSIPTTIYSTTDQVANCVVYSEFKALQAAQQTNFLSLLNIPGQLKGGSANTATLMVGMIIDYFGTSSATIANLTALSKALVQPWWQYAGYPRPFDMGDCQAAGVS